jgi:hypothetical protein
MMKLQIGFNRRYKMGYRTYFNLDIEPEPPDELLDTVIYDGFLTIEQLVNGETEDMKWYDYHEEMIELSLKYPEYVFTLDGQGEEPGDIWRSFYKNGKFHDWTLEYDLPNFDELQLK